jgi:hypothetical protein
MVSDGELVEDVGGAGTDGGMTYDYGFAEVCAGSINFLCLVGSPKKSHALSPEARAYWLKDGTVWQTSGL